MYKKNILSKDEILKLLDDDQVALIQLESFLKSFDIFITQRGIKINDNGDFHNIEYIHQLEHFLKKLDLEKYDVKITYYS